MIRYKEGGDTNEEYEKKKKQLLWLYKIINENKEVNIEWLNS